MAKQRAIITRMKVLNRTGEQYKILKYTRHYDENFIFLTVEHYQKCGFRCFYCITESQGKTRPTEPNFPALQQRFLQELADFPSDAYMFCISGATDPYNDIEEQYGYTRFVVDELTTRNRRFSVNTKGTLVVRDIDLFLRMPVDRYKVIISLSASTSELSHFIEPQAPSAEDRIAVIHQLHAAGVNVCAGIFPWVPGITDTDRLLSLLPKGIKLFLQPLDLGGAFEETLDHQRPRFSAELAHGKRWTQDEINRAYIQECNTVGKKYWKQFDTEWRHPITQDSHYDNSGYLKRMRPGRFDPDQWVAEHPVTPRIPTTSL